jgi:hypothetical protein
MKMTTAAASAADIHFQALCNAVENEKIEKCRSILQATNTTIRSVANESNGRPTIDLSAANNDGFTPLDLAFMTGHSDLVNLILDHGGVEGKSFPSPDRASAHLHALIHESRKQVEKFGHLIKAAHGGSSSKGAHISNLPTQLSQSQLKECEKQQTLWQKRMATLRRLKQGFDTSGCPHAPEAVTLQVLGPDSISVRLRSPENLGNKSLFTKCRIQWSHMDTFARLDGEMVVTEGVMGKEPEVCVKNLVEGRRYFVRASFGNPKGFGPFSAASPKSVVPSTWRSLENRVPRLTDQKEICQDIFTDIFGSDDDYEPHKVTTKRKGLRNFFSSSSASKFHRNLQPNRLYLACVFFHEDKVLMTNEEALPVIEVCDEIPQGIVSDYHYLSKLSLCSREVERLKSEMAKCGNGNTVVNFRYKIVQAVLNMQHVLGVSDLGTIFHKPFRNPDGSVVFCLTNHVKNPKQLVTLSLKWVPLSKAQRRNSFDSQISSMDILRYSLREQILFKQVSEISLPKGLYLCYLQCESSIDQMKVVVSTTSPSVLPYVKIRDNNHVTCDEWAWVHNLARTAEKCRAESSSMQAPSPTTNFLAGEGEEGSDAYDEESLRKLKPTEIQYLFGKQVLTAAQRLFDYLEISTGNDEDFSHLEPTYSFAKSMFLFQTIEQVIGFTIPK